MGNDALHVIEAAYRIELDEVGWLGQIADAARPLLDHGLGVVAYTLDATGPHTVRLGGIVSRPHDASLIELARDRLAVMPPPIAEIAAGVPLGFAASSELGPLEQLASFFAGNPHGIVDVAGVQGLDVSGASAWISIPAREIIKIQPAMRQRWQRVAAHLATAIRLRRALPGAKVDLDAADAVLDTDLRVASASPRAQPGLDALRQFARDVDRARGKLRREAPDEALALWRGLCDGTWSLVDHFDSDGRRYLVAIHNEPAVRADRALTPREQQTVAFIALGHSDKLIAYELGLAEATVQMHLASAIAKLGVTDRSELIRLALSLAPMS